MKDASNQLEPPSWPPKAHLRDGRRGANDDPAASPGENSDDMFGSEPAYTKLQSSEAPTSRFSRRQIRYCIYGGVIFGIVIIVLLSTLLTRHSADGFNPLFKKTTNLNLRQGSYKGQVIGPNKSSPRAIQAFLGVPYAESTAGQNRFHPPKALKTRADDTVHPALKYGLICPQSKPSVKGQGENCLNVNIYRPHFGDDAQSIADEEQRLGVNSTKLPVVVYVHGGGFNSGSSQERNMASFAAFSDTPIVALSFNYRVGAFGFLPSAAAARLGLLNLGLKDQQFFFKWMTDNLPAIGGDPDNVTIMGLSAGAHSVGHHLISYAPGNKIGHGPPPFQKAIIESGGATGRAVFVPNNPLHEQQFQQFLLQCGISETSDDELFDKLRGLPYTTLLVASQAVWNAWASSLRWAFQPVIDGPGGVIPDLPTTSWQQGKMLRIPLLTGFNTDEGAIFVPQGENQPTALDSLMSSILPALNDTGLDRLDELYPPLGTSEGDELYASPQESTKFGSQFWRLGDAYGHYAYICPVLQAATIASTAQGAAAPVYVYHFAPRSAAFGAADHADEGPVVAHDVGDIGGYPGLVATANDMIGAWTRFIATGDPNKSLTGAMANFTWPRYTSPFSAQANDTSAGRVALFGNGNDEKMGSAGKHSRGVPSQVVTLTDREKDECQFWWDHILLSEGYANGSTSIAL
ncbi:alpha/beta-hydrolase [Xylaria sp. CBS 124048]|nr:alpha/beta-hydrolase [Xylaria sp. CBS 124048]